MFGLAGDSTCILWDITTRQPKAIFNDHSGRLTVYCYPSEER